MWGTTRAIPTFCFVLEVVAPGLLVVKHRVDEDSPKFRNVAVFEGEQVKVLSREAASGADHPDLLRPLLGPESAPGTEEPLDVLLRLAVSMRTHRRGGTLLVVPADTEAWRESIVRPIAYAVEPPLHRAGRSRDRRGPGDRVAGLRSRDAGGGRRGGPDGGRWRNPHPDRARRMVLAPDRVETLLL